MSNKMRNGVIKRGDTWSYVIRVPDPLTGKTKQQWFGGFNTEREAKTQRAVAMAEIAEGRYVAPSAMTVRSWTEVWLTSQESRLKPKTVAGYRWQMKRYVFPRLGSASLSDVTPAGLTSLYTDLHTGGGRDGASLSVQTVRLVHMALRKCLADAVDAGELRNNPARRAKLPTREQREAMVLPGSAARLQYLDRPQVEVLRAGVDEDDPVTPVVELAIATGLRRGELLGLRWPDVMTDGEPDGYLRVRQTLVTVSGHAQFSEPKTRKSRRQFKLGTEALRILRQHRRRQAAWRLSWPGQWGNEHDLVFTREDGRLLRPDSVTRSFHHTCERLDLPSIRFHDLRHTHSTLALEAGLPVKVLSERLGHSSVQITWDTYAHVMPGQDNDFADRFDRHVYGTG